jgi:hypothetical protein
LLKVHECGVGSVKVKETVKCGAQAKQTGSAQKASILRLGVF